MKAGSETKLVTKGSKTKLEKVGRPEQELNIEKPVSVATGTPQRGLIRMSVHRAFSLIHNKETFAGKEGDVVDVPPEIAEELEREFVTNYNHEGLINMKNARRNTVQRATRI